MSNFRHLKISGFVLLCLGAASVFHSSGLFAASEVGSLEVLLITPNSENVVDVEQITATFNKAMVPLGDYESLAKDFPIEVLPKVECQWRWLNSSTLGCQLGSSLPPSNSYRIAVAAGVKALDGSVLKKASTASFSTLHWEVVSSDIEWSAPDRPEIALTFNQAMDLSSLQANATSDCGSPSLKKMRPAKADDSGVDPDRSYLVMFEKPIGADKRCALNIAPTAKSASGAHPSVAYRYDFKAYPEFRIAKVQCGNIMGHALGDLTFALEKCDPDYGLNIELSTPSTGKFLSGKIDVAPQFG